MNNEYGDRDGPATGDRTREEQQRGANHDQRRQSGYSRGFDREQAEREARDAIGNAQSELQSLLENQKNAAAAQFQAIADSLLRTAEDLDAKEQHTVATYVGHVARRIDHWSGQLRQRHIDSLAQDIQNLATRQPGLFVLGAVVAGFAATRFLKSSATSYKNASRYSDQGSSDQPSRPEALSSPSGGTGNHSSSPADGDRDGSEHTRSAGSQSDTAASPTSPPGRDDNYSDGTRPSDDTSTSSGRTSSNPFHSN